jgi:hypothetical protein
MTHCVLSSDVSPSSSALSELRCHKLWFRRLVRAPAWRLITRKTADSGKRRTKIRKKTSSTLRYHFKSLQNKSLHSASNHCAKTLDRSHFGASHCRMVKKDAPNKYKNSGLSSPIHESTISCELAEFASPAKISGTHRQGAKRLSIKNNSTEHCD